jgi:Fur family ferric uptake transcriptional regulator
MPPLKRWLKRLDQLILELIFQLFIENVGLVLHTHLGHGGATYHAAEELTHLHLVCSDCGEIGDAPIEAAANFVNTLSDDYGFKTDVTHFAIYGLCAKCAAIADKKK